MVPNFKYLCDGFTQHYLHPHIPGRTGNDFSYFRLFTNISWRPAGRRHHVVHIFDFRQPEVTDHDLRIFIHAVIQQIFWLQQGGAEESSINIICKSGIYNIKFHILNTENTFQSKGYCAGGSNVFSQTDLEVSVDDAYVMEVFDSI